MEYKGMMESKRMVIWIYVMIDNIMVNTIDTSRHNQKKVPEGREYKWPQYSE